MEIHCHLHPKKKETGSRLITIKTAVASILIFFAAVVHAQKRIDSLKQLLSRQTTDTGKVKLLVNLGNSFDYGFEKNDSALSYLNNALDLAQKINYKNGEVAAREAMGRYYYTAGDYGTAVKLLLENQKKIEELHDTLHAYYNIKDLMKAYRNMGDWDQEFNYAKKEKDLLYSGYFKDSVQFYLLLPAYLNHMAWVYSAKGKIDSAHYYLKQSYNSYYKAKDTDGMAVGANNLADSYATLYQADSALYYYTESIPYALKAKRFDVLASDYFGLGKIAALKNQTDSAFVYAYKALNLYKEMSHAEIMNISRFLAELYKRKNKFDSAYKYLNDYVTLKDSLFNRTNIIQAQNVSFNEKFHQRQLEQAKKEAQQHLKNQVKFYALAAALIIFLLIAFILYRNVRNKRKANVQLKKQKEEIEAALSELKSAQAQLIQAEKMASLGELTAGIAHEIQNPLNFVNNFSEVNNELIEELKNELMAGNRELSIEIANDIKNNEEKISHHGKRADAIVKSMLHHSRQTSGTKEPTDINALSDEYLRLSYHGIRARDKSFKAEFKTDFDTTIGKINIVPQDIGRVLLNLINNAFYAVVKRQETENEEYKPTVSVSTRKKGNSVLITVSDNGTGIPDAIKEKIFQPFFTTKPTGSGTGLGLSLSYDIIKAHGGKIQVESEEGKGTDFIIQLPIAS
jgi:signal transduction histidine kinase